MAISSDGPLRAELEHTGSHFVLAPVRVEAWGIVRSEIAVRRLASRQRLGVLHALPAAGSLATLLLPRAPRGPLIVSLPMGLKNPDHVARLKGYE